MTYVWNTVITWGWPSLQLPMGKMPKLCLCREPGLLRSLAWEILLTQPFSTAVLLMWLEQHCSASLQWEPWAACRREGEGIV